MGHTAGKEREQERWIKCILKLCYWFDIRNMLQVKLLLLLLLFKPAWKVSDVKQLHVKSLNSS